MNAGTRRRPPEGTPFETAARLVEDPDGSTRWRASYPCREDTEQIAYGVTDAAAETLGRIYRSEELHRAVLDLYDGDRNAVIGRLILHALELNDQVHALTDRVDALERRLVRRRGAA